MTPIPEIIVIVVFLLAAVGLVIYGFIRQRNRRPILWAWQAASCLQTAWTYHYFLTNSIPPGDRSALARLSFVSIGISILTLSIIASIYNAKFHK